jgi:tetraacyldisaccharide 4'-kinase
MAQLTNAPIISLTWAARPRWIATSWDRFQVPVPFARVSVVFGEPIFVPPSESSEDFEACRVLLEGRLRQLTDRMEASARGSDEGGWMPVRRALAGLPSKAWKVVCGQGSRLLARFVGRRGLEGTIRKAFQDFWSSSSPKGEAARVISTLFAPLSCLYSLVQRLRRMLYRKGLLPKRRVGLPVISIGGLRVGGSGKTPFALWMARKLSDRGCRVVLLTRGYGRKKKQGTILLTRDTMKQWSPLDSGDEPYLLAQGLPDVPVAVDADRYRAAGIAGTRFSPDLFLLDDGFQHLRLARRLDIVLVPEDEDLSGMACLPKGPLREPLSALKDADVLVFVSPDRGTQRNQREPNDTPWQPLGIDVPAYRARLVPSGLYWLEDQSRVEARDLQGHKILAFCGIARPTAFWRTLDGLGIRIDRRKDFPDHHPYSEQDHQDLLRLLSDSDCAVTTEKDAVKVSRYRWPARKVLFVRLDLILEDESAFWAKLMTMGIVAGKDALQGGEEA